MNGVFTNGTSSNKLGVIITESGSDDGGFKQGEAMLRAQRTEPAPRNNALRQHWQGLHSTAKGVFASSKIANKVIGK
ncbi:MAG TPA: hypothetical protein DIW64_01045 [Cellvibrio sp.]|nr:hypothetical protein [Cellvibrio sp.]